MTYRNLVETTAQSLGLLDADGNLVPLDSLMVVDLVVALEEAAQTRIPVNRIRSEAFESLDSVARLIADLKAS
jgi:acyl carrier protein